jgi:hypothetical protein
VPRRYSEFSPGEAEPIQRASHENWSAQLRTVGRWLTYLQREHETPDYWNLVAEEGDLLGASAGVENTPFTTQEQVQVRTALRELPAYLQQSQELAPNQLAALEARLDYLVEASSRLGRRDWLNILLGSIVSFALQEAVTSEVAKEIVQFVARSLGGIFGAELPGLPAA